MHLHIAGCHLPGIQEHRNTCRNLQCLNIWQEDGRNADHLRTHQYLKKGKTAINENVFFLVSFEIRSWGGGEVATTTKAWIFDIISVSGDRT